MAGYPLIIHDIQSEPSVTGLVISTVTYGDCLGLLVCVIRL